MKRNVSSVLEELPSSVYASLTTEQKQAHSKEAAALMRIELELADCALEFAQKSTPTGQRYLQGFNDASRRRNEEALDATVSDFVDASQKNFLPMEDFINDAFARANAVYPVFKIDAAKGDDMLMAFYTAALDLFLENPTGYEFSAVTRRRR